MQVLITWDSKHARTTDTAEQISQILRAHGHEVHARPLRTRPAIDGFQAAIIGGDLSKSRWSAPARRYVERNVHELRRIPTWLFTSTTDEETALAPPRDIRTLIARTGAIGYKAGDDIATWAGEVAEDLPLARPRPAVPLHGRALHRLVEYGLAGWGITTALTAIVLMLSPVTVALTIHALVAPLIFGMLAYRYQVVDGARSPLVTAIVWTALVAVLDALLLAELLHPQLAAGIIGPLPLIFAVVWMVGAQRVVSSRATT